MFGKIGFGELVLILLIALVIFGPKKLPEIGKAIGEALRNFRKQTDKAKEEISQAMGSDQGTIEPGRKGPPEDSPSPRPGKDSDLV